MSYKHVIPVALLTGLAGVANATPFMFTYTGEVTDVSGADLTAEMSIGDVFTIEVIADNGSSSILSQTWDVLDSISAIVTAGTYSATFSDGWFTSGSATGFSTDGAGNLIETNWFGIAFDPTAFDIFGAGGDLDNTSGTASNGDSYSYEPFLGTIAAWSGPVAIDIAEPGIVALLGFGLLGLGLARRARSGRTA